MRQRVMLSFGVPVLLAACAALANVALLRTRWPGQPDALAPGPAPASARLSGPPMSWGHSHNDYAQERPLQDALALGYRSVEADVWLSRGEVKVSHLGVFFVGTLRDLYLEPLQERVDRLGSVHGDGEPFLLWLDLGTGDPALRAALHDLLADYPMIARMDGGDARGRVLAILTGDEESKAAYTTGPGRRYACRDSNELRLGAPADPLHLWYALAWPDDFSWDGEGEMPAAERAHLRALVALSHALGRKLRLYRLPESEALWEELLRAGVDLIGTDELPRLREFLLARSAALASAPAVTRP